MDFGCSDVVVDENWLREHSANATYYTADRLKAIRDVDGLIKLTVKARYNFYMPGIKGDTPVILHFQTDACLKQGLKPNILLGITCMH